jgi:hypothetical protein
VTGRGHILLEGYLSGSCAEQRMVEQIAHEFIGSADAAPVIVPERREQPGAIDREDELGDGSVPAALALAPADSFLRTRCDQDVTPSVPLRENHGRVWKDGV